MSSQLVNVSGSWVLQETSVVSPGGSSTYVQFNDGGAFGGDSGLTYDRVTDTLTGVVIKSSAFSGSLTKLTDGSSFLLAGSGILISTGASGAVTIEASGSAGGGEYIPATFFVDGAVPVFSGTERSYVYKACTVSAVVLSAQTAPSGSSLIARINKNGSSLTTATLAAGSQYQKTSGLSFALVEGDYLTLDVTQVGSAYPGYGLIAKVIAG
jgi:hypothetical protein